MDKAQQVVGGKTGDPRYFEVLNELARLHSLKGSDYGNPDDFFANVSQSAEFGIAPWLGAVIRANDKMTRLKAFAKTGSLANESVEDSLLDAASYLIIALCLRRSEQAA